MAEVTETIKRQQLKYIELCLRNPRIGPGVKILSVEYLFQFYN